MKVSVSSSLAVAGGPWSWDHFWRSCTTKGGLSIKTLKLFLDYQNKKFSASASALKLSRQPEFPAIRKTDPKSVRQMRSLASTAPVLWGLELISTEWTIEITLFLFEGYLKVLNLDERHRDHEQIWVLEQLKSKYAKFFLA